MRTRVMPSTPARAVSALCACALLAATAGSLAFAQNAPGVAGTPASAGKPASNQMTQLPWGPSNEDLAPMTSGGSYALLTRLRQENVLLEQQLKIAQKRKELQQLEGGGNSGSSQGSSGDNSEASLAALATIGGEPRVLLVEGRPGAARAMIALPNGGTILAGRGDVVPQVGKIVSITANTVTVRTAGNKLTSVPFWNALSASSQSQATNGAVLPPPIPSRTPGAMTHSRTVERPFPGVSGGTPQP